MIGEAVSEFRGENTDGPVELRLELPVEARIPDDYIDSERLRLEAYQKLSAAATASAADDAIDLVVEELADRYGEPPAEVAGLVEVARLRRRAAQSQLADVVAMGKNLRVAPAHLADSMQVRLKRLYPGAKILANGDALVVPMPTAEGIDIVAWARQLLDAIYPLPKVES
jgi:transcription-repair coupling factor (superfamily II helicase)